MDTDSYRTFKHGPYVTASVTEWFWHNCLPQLDLREQITASPLRPTRDELEGLPPALVIVDENEVLRDEEEAYAAKLREAGVPTTSAPYNGTIHVMMLNALSDTQSARAAISQAVAALRQTFAATAI